MRRACALLAALTLLLLGLLPAHSRAASSGQSGGGNPWQGHWAEHTLATLTNLGFLTPADAQTGPDQPVPRGRITAWIAQVAGLAPFRPLAPTFRDLSTANQEAPWIEALVQAGAIRGYPDGSFRPDRPITRAEIATILTHFRHRYPLRHQSLSFSDTEGHWAAAAIQEAARREILTGYPDGSFRPDAAITYAEGATMLLRLLVGPEKNTEAALRLGSQLQAGRSRGGLITAGDMAAVVAQNYFGAPAGIDGAAALSLLRRQGLPVHQAAAAYLTPQELTAWVAALERQGFLDELPELDRNPELVPTRFTLDLQVVRSALSGTLLPQTAAGGPGAGGCFTAIGVVSADTEGLVTSIGRETALAVHNGPANRAPIAAFTVSSPVQVGERVTYTDLSFDPDGDTLNRLWAGRREQYDRPGFYTVTLTVVDPTGAAATVSREVEVRARANRPPVARFAAPGYVMAGEPVWYRNLSTDPDGDAIVEERWTGRRDSFDAGGSYTVTLEVRDSRGRWSAPHRRTITVRERPAGSGSLAISPNPVRRGEKTTVSLGCPSTVYKVWADLPAALERVPVRFGDGDTLWVENPDQWAVQGGGKTWQVRLNIPWTEDRPRDGSYPIRFTAHHKEKWSWIHTHETEVCAEPADGGEPVCRIETEEHRHWETDYWTTEHSGELLIRGTVQLIQPGGTVP